MKNYQVINSIARATEILKLLSAGISRITELGERLDLNKAAVHRILKTLEIKGLVVQDPVSRQYYLGPVIQTIASNPLAVHQSLIHAAREEMESLGDSCGETVVLQILRGGQRVVLDKVAGNEMLQFFPENMETAPLHAGAGGRALLAGLEDGQLDRILGRLIYKPLTDRTITTAEKLKQKIIEVGKKGYAVSRGENVADAMAIAVPIASYICPATLDIIGPENRLEQKKDRIIKVMIQACGRISKKLKSLKANE